MTQIASLHSKVPVVYPPVNWVEVPPFPDVFASTGCYQPSSFFFFPNLGRNSNLSHLIVFIWLPFFIMLFLFICRIISY
jgi:hypothetical protein